ncbi:MAG: hexosaminidase [Flavobacteriaceae bacterium]|jgi:hexosaminidase
MKKNLLVISVLCLLIQCKSPEINNTTVFYTINSFDVPNNKMEVSYSISNPTETIWKGGEWSLHWNTIFGEIIPESLPEGINYTYVGGQQYLILKFGSSYTLKPGENLSFTATQKGIIPRLSMGPKGFFVHDALTEKNTDLISEVNWKEAKGLEGLKIPSAKDRFNSYKGLVLLPKEEIHWVVPAPKKLIHRNKFRATSDLKLHIESFEMDGPFLQKRLQEGLKNSITVTPKEAENIHIKKNETLTKEAYTLEITDKNILIEAGDASGAFYALESLHQILLIAQNEGKGLPLLKIEDAPRFKNRGFMSDIARNFYSKEKLFQILDYMAFYKLNTFDLKLTDDDGWRLEVRGLPELTEIGSKRGYTTDESERLIPMYGSGSGDQPSSGNGFLSVQDFVDVLKYAAQRHIKVIPQISFPSHARAAIVSMKARYKNYKAQGDMAKATEYMLHDPKDESSYLSAQLYSDNVVCICDPSAYRFYEKVILEVKALYTKANLNMEIFNIGADELPYGPWEKSPKCEEYITQNKEIHELNDLYDFNVRLLGKIISKAGAQMVGWEDALLVHSENEQSEISINEKLSNLNFIPYVWNNSWGGGREDMIYRLVNKGFKAIMSNSSAFYFDMVDDHDMESNGMSWSGYVGYKDTWGTEPLNVFANKVKLEALGIDEASVASKEIIKPESVKNFLGIQSQLWTETMTSEAIFDQLYMPNLIVFSQRAWSSKEPWLKHTTASKQKPLLDKAWNRFANSLGQRQLPMINKLFGGIAHDLPKPGGIIEESTLYLRQQFPGLEIRYTLDGSEPSRKSALYEKPLKVKNNQTIQARGFDANGRGGKSILIN